MAQALAGEVGELNALRQWLAPDDIEEWLASPGNEEAVRLEIADVLVYLLLLADAVDVDPVAAALEKVALNEERFPVHESHGPRS